MSTRRTAAVPQGRDAGAGEAESGAAAGVVILAIPDLHPDSYYRGVLYDVAEARDLWTCPHRHRGWSAVDRARACAVREWKRRLRDGTRG